MNRRSSAPTIVALTYALFGAIWILVSDWVAAVLIPDPAALSAVQTIKGWLFVAGSAALIWALVRLWVDRLEKTAHHYSMLFDSSPQAMLIYDLGRLTVIEANEAAALLLGRPVASLVGFELRALMTPADGALLAPWMARLRGDGADSRGLWRLLRGDGAPIEVEIHSRAVDHAGRSARLALLTDVTARLTAERGQRDALAALERSDSEWHQVSAVAAHDLQEPLRMVVSYLQLLDRRYRGRLDEDADTYIGFAVEGALRLKGLVAELADFITLEAHPARLVDANAVMADLARRLGPRLDELGAVLAFETLPIVEIAPDHLRRVFDELIDNALKFRDPDRALRVAVSASPIHGGWEIAFADNGQGVPPDCHERVFGMFRRLHPATPGLGAGLPTCRKLLGFYGGTIRMARPDQGAIVFLTLPSPAGRRDPPSLTRAATGSICDTVRGWPLPPSSFEVCETQCSAPSPGGSSDPPTTVS
ncbi:MAG: PAS domain-containing protein [Alphaproteobacteria bacterium]|nr:PAS domain-containing protein [Alphaproteobacteria bacterium]